MNGPGRPYHETCRVHTATATVPLLERAGGQGLQEGVGRLSCAYMHMHIGGFKQRRVCTARRLAPLFVDLKHKMRTPSLLVVALGCSALQTPPPPARRTAAAPNYACGPASKPAPPVQLPADKQVNISIEH